MAFDRTTIIQEAGVLVYNSATFYSVGPINVDLIESPFDIETDAFGPVDKRIKDRRIEIKLTPIGELEALSTLFPHGAKAMGASLYGSSDVAAVIYTASGKSLTVHNVAVTKQPVVKMGHDQTLFGEVVLTGLLRKSYDADAANAYYTYVASGATYPGDAAFSATAIKTLGFSGAWGASSPWDEFFTENGFTLDTALKTEDVMVDGHGTIDIRLVSIEAKVTATPVGISAADLLTKRAFQGGSLGARRTNGDDLIITNQTGSLALHVQLYGANIDDGQLKFSGSQRGTGEVTWTASREFAAGVAVPLYYIGTSAPA
jgi:hypothetical protein